MYLCIEKNECEAEILSADLLHHHPISVIEQNHIGLFLSNLQDSQGSNGRITQQEVCTVLHTFINN